MRLAFWVNDVSELTAKMTTSMLIGSAVARGHHVWAVTIGDLSLDPRGRVLASATPLSPRPEAVAGELTFTRGAPEDLDLLTCDGVLIRTNPGRDLERATTQEECLGLAELLQRRGVVVLNDPVGLRRAKSKVFLATLPNAYHPPTLVSGDPKRLAAFVEAAETPCVAKPLVGTRGQSVFKLHAKDPNLQAIISLLVAHGPALVQGFVPGAEKGDLRLVVLEGEPLVLEGHTACVQRVPCKGEWRSNIHLGGEPAPGKPTDAQLAAGRALGEILLREGIVLAGLDLIGDQAVELNVYSTGGLRDANRFAGVDFTQPILDAFERRISAPRTAG